MDTDPSSFNGPEELIMRSGYFRRCERQHWDTLGVLIGGWRALTHRLLNSCGIRTQHAFAGLEFYDLDELAQWTTPPEMAELIEHETEMRERAERHGRRAAISYVILPDGTLKTNLTTIPIEGWLLHDE